MLSVIISLQFTDSRLVRLVSSPSIDKPRLFGEIHIVFLKLNFDVRILTLNLTLDKMQTANKKLNKSNDVALFRYFLSGAIVMMEDVRRGRLIRLLDKMHLSERGRLLDHLRYLRSLMKLGQIPSSKTVP